MNVAHLFLGTVDNSVGIVIMIVAELLSLAYFMSKSKAAKNENLS